LYKLSEHKFPIQSRRLHAQQNVSDRGGAVV
jgi:hypothetical protein